MNRFFLLVPILGLTACAGDRPVTSSAPAPATLPGNPVSAVDDREPSRVHTYLINDYVDPNNPRIMHEGHSVDVVEQDEKWNLHPAIEEGAVTTGPVTAADNPNVAPNPYTAEFEAELAQQREQFKALSNLGVQMNTEMGRLEELGQKEADAVSENAAIRTRLEDLQREIDGLKAAPNPPSTVNAPKKSSWFDSIYGLFRPVPDDAPATEQKFDLQTNMTVQPVPPLTAPAPVPPASTNTPDEMPSPGEMAHPQDNNDTTTP
jgi:regulator of replication initiation timing